MKIVPKKIKTKEKVSQSQKSSFSLFIFKCKRNAIVKSYEEDILFLKVKGDKFLLVKHTNGQQEP